MRMLGRLKTPCPSAAGTMVYTVMLHETAGGTYAYLYTGPEALFSTYDLHYDSLADALEGWGNAADSWTVLDDPLPGCQHDCPLPVRIKGRERGKPQWGQYEILEHGEWKDFAP